MPNTDDATTRKRKRPVGSQADKTQRCIDHFFVARDSSDAGRAPPCNDPSAASSEQPEQDQRKTRITPTLKRQAVEPNRQPDPQLCLEDAQHNKLEQQRPNFSGRTATLSKQQAALPAYGRVANEQNCSGKKVKASGVPGPDADAQRQLLEDLATFNTFLTERQQFRE